MGKIQCEEKENSIEPKNHGFHSDKGKVKLKQGFLDQTTGMRNMKSLLADQGKHL